MVGDEVRDHPNVRIVFTRKKLLLFALSTVQSTDSHSADVSAREKQGQNSGGPHQGVIGCLGISSAVRPF